MTAQTEDNKLILLYNIKQGPSDKSFGIHIAELAGFPPSVIQVARHKVELLENTVQNKGVSGSTVAGQKRFHSSASVLPQLSLLTIWAWQSTA